MFPSPATAIHELSANTHRACEMAPWSPGEPPRHSDLCLQQCLSKTARRHGQRERGGFLRPPLPPSVLARGGQPPHPWKQMYVIVLESLHSLIKPSDVVYRCLPPALLELVRGDQDLEAFTLLLMALLTKFGLKLCQSCSNSMSISVRFSFSRISADGARWRMQFSVRHRYADSSCCSSHTTHKSHYK